MNKEQKTENKAQGTKNNEQRTKNNEEKTFRFLFVNQFIPPDPAPTARLIDDVAGELRARGHEIVLVGDGGSYHGSKTLFGSRALRELSSLVRLFFRAVFTRRVDAIVCLTSPPLLPVVAWLARFPHRRSKLIHWAMDLYPDVAVALGEVKRDSLLHRLTSSMMNTVYRSCDLVVVLDRGMAESVDVHGPACEIHPPWPPAAVCPPPSATRPPIASRPFRWLYSGNLGRAHEWKTLLEAQRLLEESGSGIELVFQGGGAERAPAMRHAEAIGLNHCLWLPYADEEDLIPSLLAADCLIATQRPETNGCLWPSKLALALLLDRPLVWVGAKDGSVSSLLREKGHSSFSPGEANDLASHLLTLSKAPANREPGREHEEREAAVNRIQSARKEGITSLADRFERTAL